MKKISVFMLAALGLASVSFAQPSEQEIKDYIKKNCGNNDQECICIISHAAPNFPSIEAMEKVNKYDFSEQDIKKLNQIVDQVNKQCGTNLNPAPIEGK